MQFQVLGPLDVSGPAGALNFAGQRRRALIAVLLVNPCRSVSLPGLVDGIWADNPPHSAIANIRNYVSDFRRQLKQVGDSPARLTSNLTGYRLDVAAEELDLFRFSELVADGRQALRRGDRRRAVDRLGLALGLWRGRPLEDLPGLGAAVAAKLDAWEEQRWAVTACWIDARLALGQHDEMIPVLRQLVAERPLDEQVRAQLIVALHTVGRKADALVAFRDARRAAIEELGVEPGAHLQRLHSAILNNEPLPQNPTFGDRLADGPADRLPHPPIAVSAPPAAGPAGPEAPALPSPLPRPPQAPPPSPVPPAGVEALAAAGRRFQAEDADAPCPDRLAAPGQAAGAGPDGAAGADGGRERGPVRGSRRGPEPEPDAGFEAGWLDRGPGPVLGRVGVRSLRPRGLPPRPQRVVGRDRPVDELEAIGRSVADRSATQGYSSVAVISGPPGVGKTTVALAAAYRLLNQYPHGQLYLRLRGSTDAPMPVGEALAELLGALGVEERHLPAGVSECAMLYRSMLADRRMLVILDDATSARTLRPLLPGAGRCLAIVTSGSRLVELDPVWRCDLGPLTGTDAVQMLADLVGADRIGAEPEGAARIAAACERLPLALRVAGLRLSTLPGVGLETFADRLADEQRRLDELAVGDLSVRGRLGRSYRTLDPTARRLMTAMAMSGEQTFTGASVGELLDIPGRIAERVLERLSGHHLMAAVGGAPRATQHYEMPELIRLYVRGNPESAARN